MPRHGGAGASPGADAARGDGCPRGARAAILACRYLERTSSLQFEPRDQFEQRQKKLEQIQELGHAAFPHEFRWTHSASDIQAGFGETRRRSLRLRSRKYAWRDGSFRTD